MPEAFELQARALLATAPGRITQQRVATLATLLSLDDPQTHTDLQALMPDLDRVSLYRALDWLCEHGLAYQLTGTDGVRRYARNGSESEHAHHPHFECTNCGSTACLPPVAIPAQRLPKGYLLKDTTLIARGLCANCIKPKR